MKVGVILIIEGNEKVGIPRYQTVRELALQAEGSGFDSVWLYDHLLFAGEPPVGQWECFTFLAALAEATERVELGTLVACTAFRNPAMLAKIATALDEVSGGRFTLGLGAGWNEREFNAFNLPFDRRVDRFEEAVQIIVPLVREGRVDFHGKYVEANDCLDIPRGPRAGGPPIMIAGTGSRMLRLAATYGDSVNTGFDLTTFTPGQTPVDEACRAVGRDPQTLPVTMPGWAAFPDLGPTPEHMKEAELGSAKELADVMRSFERAGVGHVMFDFRPNTAASLERVTKALRLYRGEGS
jgi:alkanesulfonate monooxygenase SsuD/methylene tetrahydromethanopterin reductase-like flavin-dependent oxidoreductase (luciferase family)